MSPIINTNYSSGELRRKSKTMSVGESILSALVRVHHLPFPIGISPEEGPATEAADGPVVEVLAGAVAADGADAGQVGLARGDVLLPDQVGREPGGGGHHD